MAGIIKNGKNCQYQGYYFSCRQYGGMCPYIHDGKNFQNDCPTNQLKGFMELKKESED